MKFLAIPADTGKTSLLKLAHKNPSRENYEKTSMSGKERAIKSIRDKLHFAGIRPETLVHLCEKEDRNKDELLNTHDLEDVLRDTLGE